MVDLEFEFHSLFWIQIQPFLLHSGTWAGHVYTCGLGRGECCAVGASSLIEENTLN